MANININVGAIVCENPVFTNVVATATRFEYLISWTSEGDYYYSFDDTAIMSLQIQLYHPLQTVPYYTGYVGGSIDFNMIDLPVNILDYEGEYSPKDSIVFTLILSGVNSCNVQTTYTIPGEP